MMKSSKQVHGFTVWNETLRADSHSPSGLLPRLCYDYCCISLSMHVCVYIYIYIYMHIVHISYD